MEPSMICRRKGGAWGISRCPSEEEHRPEIWGALRACSPPLTKRAGITLIPQGNRGS